MAVGRLKQAVEAARADDDDHGFDRDRALKDAHAQSDKRARLRSRLGPAADRIDAALKAAERKALSE
jgi:hypothetical protein